MVRTHSKTDRPIFCDSWIQLVVVQGDQTHLLRFEACKQFNLIKVTKSNNNNTTSKAHAVEKEYQDVFKGLGCIHNEKIQLKPDTTRVVHAPKWVLVALCEKMKDDWSALIRQNNYDTLGKPIRTYVISCTASTHKLSLLTVHSLYSYT